MRLDPEEDREPIASLVRDDFKTPHTYTVADACQHIMAKVRDHGGKWPAYMTGSHFQCRRWERDIAFMEREMLQPANTVLTILVYERTHPVHPEWARQRRAERIAAHERKQAAEAAARKVRKAAHGR